MGERRIAVRGAGPQPMRTSEVSDLVLGPDRALDRAGKGGSGHGCQLRGLSWGENLAQSCLIGVVDPFLGGLDLIGHEAAGPQSLVEIGVGPLILCRYPLDPCPLGSGYIKFCLNARIEDRIVLAPLNEDLTKACLLRRREKRTKFA